ncbi:carboxypeptidase B-like [Agrilus planipennis]|uniref:Carboxypeptidase B-like n=1 Tax=Agrilus planipennis TaxID=224129 RepID=A0A7F5R1C7_AGRPL|nr:carboxypeptidase B-like [Agrilus planipennis]
MTSFLYLVIINIVILCSHAYVTYDNYKVYRVYLDSPGKVNSFSKIHELIPKLDVWNENVADKSIDVMVPPEDQYEFTDSLSSYKIQQEVFISNVAELIDKYSEASYSNRLGGEFNWTTYQTYEQIVGWLESLAQTYPDNVTTVVLGKSHYGVDIVGAKLVLNPNATRVAIIEGGIHAREWISPATVTYILNSFLTSSLRRVRNAAESMIWYFVPSINPDGYNRTFHEDRLHRKNVQVVNGTNCSYFVGGNGIGTDLNRNFNYTWMEAGGASSRPCSSSYAGPEPFSAPETRAMKALVEQVSDSLDLYICFHSFSQLVLFPYGHTTDPIDNYYEQYAIARMAADELEAYNGTKYVVGNIAEAIYVSTGSSLDWVKGTYGTRLTYGLELRDQGQYGFLLPPDQIIDTGEETLNAVVVLVEQLFRLDLLTFTRPSGQGSFTQFLPHTLFLSVFIIKFYTIGRMAADAIESNSGRKYIVGNSAEAIYISTGGSDDWVKGTFGTRLVYTYEVRDTGTYGFLLPPDQIIDTAE